MTAIMECLGTRVNVDGEEWVIFEAFDEGCLGLHATDEQRLGEIARLNAVVEDLESKGYEITKTYVGLAHICYGLGLGINGINSFIGKFVDLFHALKGSNDGWGPSFTKQGSRIVESRFEYRGVDICYDGNGREAYIDNNIVFGWLDRITKEASL
jgi:hypothetical protein